MSNILSDILKYFSFDDVNIDNHMFKMFYKVSMAICMAGAAVGIANDYFGDPISCDVEGIDKQLAEDYCWLHGSSYVPLDAKQEIDAWRKENNKDTKDSDTSYYQWVSFMFCFQALIFFIPYKIWSSLEGGLMASFGTEGRARVMFSKDAGVNHGGVVKEAVVEKFVTYYLSIWHRNSWYWYQFVACEFLNFILLGVQFKLTNWFLNGKFSSYGLDVVSYYSKSYEERNDLTERGNPVLEVFPIMTSCYVPNFGRGGQLAPKNALCVLTQNIINEKIYLVLWWWYVILASVTCLFVIYRLLTIFFPPIRIYKLNLAIHGNKPDNQTKSKKTAYQVCDDILKDAHMGDWFVLMQLSKNCNQYFFRDFIKELANEIEKKNKKKNHQFKNEESNPLSCYNGENNLREVLSE